jgi:acylphosphatase
MLSRKHIYFQGRVQGVGFRFTARTLAGGFAVTGFVRNLPNGDVELVAEGEPPELNGFLQALRDEMASNITAERTTGGQATGEFTEFQIRH